MRRALALATGLLAAGATARADAIPFATAGRLIHYAPRAGRPSARALRLDAEELARRGFATVLLDAVPRDAAAAACRRFGRHGFRAIIVVVGDPHDAAALSAARRLRRCADAYAVGTGGLARDAYTALDLAAAITGLRSATGKPVGTRELLPSYDDPGLVRLGDWLLVLPTPDVRAQVDPRVVCGAVSSAYHALAPRLPPATTLVVDEVGVPTAGESGANEHYQRALVGCVESRGARIAFPRAFDDDTPGSGSRGLFRPDGTPKLWARAEAAPAIAFDATAAGLRGVVRNVAPPRVRVIVYRMTDGWVAEAPITPDRRGHWHAAPGEAPAAAVLVASGAAPPSPTPTLPRVDGVLVLASSPGG